MTESADSLLWEVSALEFFGVTVMLAGTAACLAGRATARAWAGLPALVLYVVLLTGGTRFLHFALFNGSLLSPYYFGVDFLMLLALAGLARHITRSRQMATQYRFRPHTRPKAPS